MNFRSDSLHDRLTQEQRDELMITMIEARGKRAIKGLALLKSWGVQSSLTSVTTYFSRYNFAWRLERGAWVARQTNKMSDFALEQKKLLAQRLFAQAADVNADPRFLILLRGLELQQDKIAQRDRLAKTQNRLDLRRLKLTERKLQLLEERVEKARAVIGDSKLSPEEMKARFNEVFGLPSQ